MTKSGRALNPPPPPTSKPMPALVYKFVNQLTLIVNLGTREVNDISLNLESIPLYNCDMYYKIVSHWY